MVSVELESVSKVFADGTVAVDDLSLQMASGELMVLLGPSGCGKSTALRIIAGLEEATGGTVYLGGAAANHLRPHERGVAMVFQNFALYPHRTVEQNLAFPLELARRDASEISSRVTDMALALGVSTELGRRPWQISGGQRQRVAIGRALIRQPDIWLLDEPLSNLDSGMRARLRTEIVDLVRQLGATTIYVTHDQTEALTMADRVAVLRDGVLQDVGTPAQVYNRPATMYVASFLGTPRMNLVYARVSVDLDNHVVLHLGDQQLAMPWTDYRRHVLTHYHGEHIVIGVRPEALAPAGDDHPGNVLRGRVRYFEHLGHESLAYVDVGAMSAHGDQLADPDNAAPTTPHATSPKRKRWGRQPSAEEPQSPATSEAGRHHRRPAELAVRMRPYPGIAVGAPLAVQVHVEQLHLFDPRGPRIDAGQR